MKQSKIKKGMVLAAGLGTRLHPITQEVPKPMVPVLNVPNILHSLFLLKRAGITQIILNLHHLPDQLESFLGTGKTWGLDLRYSKEAVLLGTGGGLKRAESFFGGEPLVLANCDFISDVDLRPIIERHFERKALGTMVLYENAELQRLYSKVGLDRNSHLCSLPRIEVASPERHGIFTGIHVLDPSAFEHLPEKPSGINEILYPHWMKEAPDRVFCDFMSGYWHDTGDFPALFSASMKLLEQLHGGHPVLSDFMKSFAGFEEKSRGLWMPRQASVPSNIRIKGPVMIGNDCQFESGVELGPYTILGDGAFVGERATLSRFVGLGRPQISSREVSEGAVQFHRSKLPLKPLKSVG